MIVQAPKFSDLEGLRIAVEMERRGEEFYRHAARIAKNGRAVALLAQLAADELSHQREFARLVELMLSEHSGEEYYDEEASMYLSAVAADVVFKGGLMSLVPGKGFDSPIAILESAISSEKDSILFYTEMIIQARSREARQVFEEIVRQEKQHLGKLQKSLLEQQPIEE